MEIWQEWSLTLREKKIWDLASIYHSFNKKRGSFRNFLPTKSDPRESKNWKYFEQTYLNFESDPTFDPYIFMEAQYRDLKKGEILYPAQLKTKTAINKYQEHRNNKKVIDSSTDTERILINLTSTYKFIKKWWKNNNKEFGDYESFFKVAEGEIISDGFSYCIQGMISKYFISVSRTFNKYYSSLDPDIKWEIIPPKDLKSYRIALKLDEDAWDFAKDIFGNEVN
jgi:hypothetical protein